MKFYKGEIGSMQEFFYKMVEDGSFCVIGYKGDEAEVIIPEDKNITMLYDRLFKGHDEITSVKIPDTVTDLGEFVFDGCVNLRHLTLPSHLKYLWGYTFVRSGIEEITIPSGVKAIPSFAFKECKNLKRVVCGSGMQRIYAWAFSGCDELKEEQLVYEPGVEVSPQAFETKNL